MRNMKTHRRHGIISSVVCIHSLTNASHVCCTTLRIGHVTNTICRSPTVHVLDLFSIDDKDAASGRSKRPPLPPSDLTRASPSKQKPAVLAATPPRRHHGLDIAKPGACTSLTQSRSQERKTAATKTSTVHQPGTAGSPGAVTEDSPSTRREAEKSFCLKVDG